MDEEDLEQQDSGDEEPYDGQDDEEEGSQENVDGEKNYELESIKIKASRDRLEHRARNSKQLTIIFSFYKQKIFSLLSTI